MVSPTHMRWIYHSLPLSQRVNVAHQQCPRLIKQHTCTKDFMRGTPLWYPKWATQVTNDCADVSSLWITILNTNSFVGEWVREKKMERVSNIPDGLNCWRPVQWLMQKHTTHLPRVRLVENQGYLYIIKGFKVHREYALWLYLLDLFHPDIYVT